MDVFQYSKYKKAIREITESRRKQFGNRFTFERVAQAAGVQKAYLSRILSGAGNLNADQVFAACEFLKLKEAESEYILLLREFETASNKERQQKILKKIEGLRKARQRTEVALAIQGNLEREKWSWDYYTDPDLHLVHMFLTVRKYSAHPELIGKVLGISPERLQNILLKLQEWGLVKYERGRYVAGEPLQHLSEESPIFKPFAALQRVRSLERARQPQENDFFFTAVFSAQQKDRDRLRQELLAVLDSAKKDIADSEAQDVFQINIDLMKWS